jgi:hypothetical protein
MPQIKYTKSAWDNLLQVQYHLLDEMLKSICNIQFAMGKLSLLIALRQLAEAEECEWG